MPYMTGALPLRRLLRSGLPAGTLLLITAALLGTGTVAAAPGNDAFASAIAVPALPYTNTQSTVDATLQTGESVPCGNIDATVWYSFAPLSAATVKVKVTALFDTVLAVYSGSSLPALNLIECNDDTGVLGSAVQFNALPGTPYRIQVGGVGGSGGDITIEIETGVPPANDSFSGSHPLADPLPALDSRNTIVATLEDLEPDPSCAAVGRTAWYVYTPSQTGLYRVRTEGSDFDTVLGVYTGSAVNSLSNVGCNDDAPSSFQSEVLFPGAAGKAYRIQAGGYQGDSGNLSLTLESETDVSDADGDGYGAGAEEYIGTGASDPCGHDGWPSNVWDSGLSLNKLDVQDVTSFLAPVRRLNSSPPSLSYNARWDLSPGATPPLSNYINAVDITTLIASSTGYPPMFSGQRAFNKTCPQP